MVDTSYHARACLYLHPSLVDERRYIYTGRHVLRYGPALLHEDHRLHMKW